LAADPSPPAITAIYAFGDSYSDAGNQWISTNGAQPVSPPYADGRWSNGNVWVQDLAAYYGRAALTPSEQGGTDFARGGAETGSSSLAGTGFDLSEQFAAFQAQVTAPAAGALYTLDIGINDLLAILKTGDDVAAATPLADASAQAEAAFAASLVATGAADIAVLNVPDLGVTPFEVISGPAAAAEATALSRIYDTALQSALATVAGAASVHVIDAFGLFDSVVANPTAFGLSDATDPVWSGNGADSTSGTLRTTVAAAQNQYFFWDIVHPTAAGQSLFATLAEQAIGPAPCFAAGTRILTARGEVPVERLQIGDCATTRDGRLAPIRWLGHRRIDSLLHPRPWDICPVRVQAGAFGAAAPHRDLLLSPDHAILFAAVLIPVRHLLDGTTIARAPGAAVTYWHVELDRHDIVLAEGLPCESFLDTGNRAAFANGGAVTLCPPDFVLHVWQGDACAPLCRAGAEVAAARRHLLARASAVADAESRLERRPRPPTLRA